MARLPSAADIRRRPAPADTPGVRVGSVDYTPAASASTALGKGLGALGAGIGIALEASEDQKNYELQRKYLDWKLDTELALEEHKRAMPAGGEGYAAEWQRKFRDRARAFVGEDDKNIPAHMRGQLGVDIKNFDVALARRAARDEYDERDRKVQADTEVSLGKRRELAFQSPDELYRLRLEGQAIINGARATPAARAAWLDKYEHEIEIAAASGLASRVNDRASLQRLADELQPNVSDKVSARNVAEALRTGKRGAPAGWARSNATWQGLDSYQKAALMALMEADGTDIEDARNALGAMINRAAKNNEELGAHVSQKIYQPVIESTQERRMASLMASPKFGQLTEWARRRAEGQEPDPVNGATHFLASEKTMLDLERREPRKYRSWRSWTGYDDARGEYRGVIMRDKSHAFLAPEGTSASGTTPDGSDESGYNGPFSKLNYKERQAVYERGLAQFDKIKKGTEQAIDKQMGIAIAGRLPPEAVMDGLRRNVEALADPSLASKMALLEQTYQLKRDYGRAPMRLIQAEIDNIERWTRENGSTPEIEATRGQLEKIRDSGAQALQKDPLTWAAQNGVRVPVDFETIPEEGADRPPQMAALELEQLDFRADPDTVSQKLAYRIQQAKMVKAYYGDEVPLPRVFREAEAEVLKGFMVQGGQPMLDVLGTIVSEVSKAGLDPVDTVREFSKDAPEVAMIGELIANDANQKMPGSAAHRTAQALADRAKSGDKYISSVDRARAKPALGEYADLFSLEPARRDQLSRAADLLYEFEARRQKVKPGDFDSDLYDDVLRELMGEVKADDHTYGGVAQQDSTWTRWTNWRSSPKVLVPPGIRNDSFEDFKGAIRSQDLAGSPPRYSNGKPMPASVVRSSTWVSVGHGKYLIQVAPDTFAESGVNGTPYVLDVRPLMASIKRRNPELFIGYNGNAVGVPEEDRGEAPQGRQRLRPVIPSAETEVSP